MKRKSPKETLSTREKILWLKARSRISSSGCWEWIAGFSGVGYGRVASWIDKSRYAHRAMFSLAIAPIPDGIYVLHSCDNRKCINPSHLWSGSHLENQVDKKNKGRHNYKFSDQDIAQMRRFRSYGIARKEIIDAFKISTFWFDRTVKENRREI